MIKPHIQTDRSFCNEPSNNAPTNDTITGLQELDRQQTPNTVRNDPTGALSGHTAISPKHRQSLWHRFVNWGKGLVVLLTAFLAPWLINPSQQSTPTVVAADEETKNADNLIRNTPLSVQNRPFPIPMPAGSTFNMTSLPTEYTSEGMNIILIATLINALLCTGNLIKLGTEFLDKMKRVPNELEVDNIILDAEKKAEESATYEHIKQINQILPSDEIKQVLIGKIQAIKAKITSVYREPGMLAYNMLQEAENLRRDFCLNVNEIKKYNAGKLPDLFEREWSNYSCSKYTF